MDFFKNILTPQEVKHRLVPSDETDDSILLGTVIRLDPRTVITVTQLWCPRVDYVIALDIEVNGSPSENARCLIYNRGFTYLEYLDLFNDHIEPHEYPHYPIFNQLRKRKGGINTKKQRYTYLSRYQANEEDYLKCYLEEVGTMVLDFYMGQIGKLFTYLPMKKIRQHAVIPSPTGTGKSSLIATIFYSIQKKYPSYTLIMIDPHGDLALSIKRNPLTYQQRERLIYFDPFLADGYTPGFNPLEINDTSDKNLGQTAEQIIVAFEEVLTKTGGKPTELQIGALEQGLYFILVRSEASIENLIRFFTPDSPYKEEAYEFDPQFDDFFFKPGNKTREGIHKRLLRAVNNPVLKNVFTGRSTFPLEDALNSGKLLVFNLDGFGEMAQVTFGKFLIANIKSYVRKRNKNTGIPIICFVDEAHQLVSGSFEYILAQLRGFGLSMVMATQFMQQFGDQALDIKKNTAIKIAGGDIDDVKEVMKVDKDLTLKDYEFMLKVRGKGQTIFKSPSFMAKNKNKYTITPEQEAEIDRMQMDRYYKPIGQVQTNKTKGPAAPDENSKPKDEKGLPKPPFDLFLGDDEE